MPGGAVAADDDDHVGTAPGAIQILYQPRPGGQGIIYAISYGDAAADHLFGS